MAVIADWPHVPKQIKVQKEIDAASNGYVALALCAPTSILSADRDGRATRGWHRPVGRGRRGALREQYWIIHRLRGAVCAATRLHRGASKCTGALHPLRAWEWRAQ
jgi:hypothetical protein